VKCSPPLPDDELGKIIKSVCTKPVGMSDEAKRSAAKAKTRKFDHAGIAQKLMKEHSMCFIDGMPAIYGNGRYTIGWNAVCREIINLDGNATNSNQKEVIHYLTVMGEHKRQSPPNLIAFENGVLDIETMELRDWETSDIIPNVIPHNWRGMVECKDVDTVLMKMACGDESTYYSLIEVMGVCMYRSAEFTQSAILLGTGSNGKSTYIRMIQALLGYDNISSLDLGALGQQFLTGLVAGKLANLGDDISNKFKDGDKLTVFKKMVDGNRQHADVKNIEGFDFNPYATMVFSCNEFPSLDDYTDGMMRRLFPVEFNAKFSKTDPDYDPRISKKVATEEACERMCWLGVLGLSRVIDNNGFTPTCASTRRVNEILSDNDTTLAWMEDESRDTDWFDNKPVSDAYQDYRIWCDRSGLHAVGRTKFTRRIKARLKLDANVKWHGGKSTRVFEKV
ncbi:MAG: hypothetical protein IJ113_00945, partial [Eggerthellaceae bacterium]|nr:hypothetical protein [Eggerthellaceae bacterium]